ncbi:hypothetical protein ZEAMMB73_Zm00001d028031 [Zea mays]|uniref:Peptidase S9 prolyl oligopeptidase catalytic domain-containing protein n=1 Tax=Zea mays TaxID=4577 RepID=A0A1D6JRD1_MAIZE|nr:hypothetical protein ZEAMMB73_Zm00001d028031 [Zea mays]
MARGSKCCIIKSGRSMSSLRSGMYLQRGRDKVVPLDQAHKIYNALKEKVLPIALVEYEGEQHGFREAENIKFTLEQQMVFFARLFGKFELCNSVVFVHDPKVLHRELKLHILLKDHKTMVLKFADLSLSHAIRFMEI